MRLLRLYAPAIVIAVWAILTFAISFGHEIRAIASLAVAVALKVQVDEARRQHRDRKDS